MRVRSAVVVALLVACTGGPATPATPAIPLATPIPTTPNRTIGFDALDLDREAGLFLHHGEPYSGFAERLDARGGLFEKAGFLDGKRHGPRTHFYPNGERSSEVTLAFGRLQGTTRTWWPDGTLRSQGHNQHGVAEGVHREWYQSGALFKEMNLVNGVEQGLQRAWRENGALYSNYEAKNGRIFGLRRSKLCFQLKNEEIARAD